MHESQIPRSCDRCYASKERCVRAASSDSCDRCIHLNYACTLNRAIKRPGRKPRNNHHQPTRELDGASPSSESSAPAGQDVSALLDNAVARLNLSSNQAALLRQSFIDDNFDDQFLIGPSFNKIHREYMAKKLFELPAMLGDAFIAVALSWGEATATAPKIQSEMFERMFHYATAAVATLCAFQPVDTGEMSACLVLGVTILMFALKHRVADARAICRQTLAIAKPIYESHYLMKGPSAEDVCLLSGLVLTDIAESLMFGEPPILRYRVVSDPGYVDRYVGISCSSLPLLHDIAELSFKFKLESGKSGNHQAALSKFEGALHTLHQETCKWLPTVPANFSSAFNSVEVAHMICQVGVLRNLALLVLHRLRHRYGSEDVAAHVISLNLISSLETTTTITQSIPRCMDFPLVAACLEVPHKSTREDYLSSMSAIAIYSQPFQQRTKEIFDAFWEARQRGVSMYWYDIAQFIPNYHSDL